ncbi:MAG: thioredoxin-dependent thiol peroxidase [Nitrospinota bacterium]|nr:thioredoxin-dependent thiol peroxidase [Nitrospinota bacterium]
MALKAGSKAPAFSLPNQDERKINLKDYSGQWVVLYFYPKDNTSGCTLEAQEFTKAVRDFEKLGAVILGVSADTTKSHMNFVEKKGLGINLLSDTEKNMLKKYDTWKLKKMAGKEYMGIVRTTYLINPMGKIAEVWDKVKAKGHAKEVLDKLTELKGG